MCNKKNNRQHISLTVTLLCPENSLMANARFQAATAIRDAAIREWSFLSPDEKKSLIRYYYDFEVIPAIQFQCDLFWSVTIV